MHVGQPSLLLRGSSGQDSQALRLVSFPFWGEKVYCTVALPSDVLEVGDDVLFTETYYVPSSAGY